MSGELVYWNPVGSAKKIDFVSVIMAGGQGTRFWPLSRRDLPKQFLPVPTGGCSEQGKADAQAEESLIGATARRMSKLGRGCGALQNEQCQGHGAVLVVTGKDHVGLVKERLPTVSILGEPIGRNTAPCAAYAARFVLDTIGDVPLLTVPADHLISNELSVLSIFSKAVEIARTEDVLLTVGIRPTFPETGYGYIERGESYGTCAEASRVKRFVEKPDLATAQEYLEHGSYFWNSGMFVWRPSVFLKQVDKHLPVLGEQMRSLTALWHLVVPSGDPSSGGEEFERSTSKIFSEIASVSVDVGVMEKADNVVMLTEGIDGIGWSDIGSWSAWADAALVGTVTESGGGEGLDNVLHANSVLLDSSGCVLVGRENKLIAGIGLKDLVVIDTDDALLIIPKERTQEVRRIVDELKVRGRLDLL